MQNEKIWEILQIPPTNSKKEIRLAYAKLTKLYHPEEAPDAFERLHTAYELALKQTANPTTPAQKQETSVLTISEISSFQTQDTHEETPCIQDDIQSDMEKWEETYDDWFYRLTQLVETYAFSNFYTIPPLNLLENISCIRTPYTESEAFLTQVQELFSKPITKWACFQQRTQNYLFSFVKQKNKIPGNLQSLLPYAIVQEFYNQYEKKSTLHPSERIILHYLMRVLTFYRRLPEYNCHMAYDYNMAHSLREKMKTKDFFKKEENETAFWEYFLAYGYTCRSIECVSAETGEDYPTLTAYMEEFYAPSIEWRKEFTNFYANTQTEYYFSLSDGRCLHIEFHLYYVRYTYVGAWENNRLSFLELCKETEQNSCVKHFFFLLGITDILPKERHTAEKVIHNHLKKLPLYQPTLLPIAQYLANLCVPEEIPEKKEKRIQFTLYQENERFCFRIQASLRKFEVDYYTKNGWTSFGLLSGEAKAYKKLPQEERETFLKQKARSLKQPTPILRRSISLDGKNKIEKTNMILDALCEYGREEAKKEGCKTRIPFTGVLKFPQAAHDFFEDMGGDMFHSYVVLHFGTSERPRFHRIFTVLLSIFLCGANRKEDAQKFFHMNRESYIEAKIQEEFYNAGTIGFAEDSIPYPVFIGESGTFYSSDEINGLITADSFEELMQKLFDFTDVSSIDIFDGIMSKSKLDNQIEYCYNYADYYQELYEKEQLLLSSFTTFRL